MNVAITRAKHSLFVVGNSLTLSSDKNWNAFIKFCKNYDITDDKSETQLQFDCKTFIQFKSN